jgi:hypothetical protein
VSFAAITLCVASQRVVVVVVVVYFVSYSILVGVGRLCYYQQIETLVIVRYIIDVVQVNSDAGIGLGVGVNFFLFAKVSTSPFCSETRFVYHS